MIRLREIVKACLFACIACATRADPPASRPPNVLFLIGDDHAAYVCGAYGEPRARTPNLDRFAATAMRFTRAYCNSPVCTASRQSFLTGRLPHSIGVTLLKTPLGESPVTLAELLAQSPGAYATAAIGKMHFNSELHHGFGLLYDMKEIQTDLRARGPLQVADSIETQPPWKPFVDPARIWLNARNLPQKAHIEDMPGTLLAERAVKFMRENKDRPFLLFASFHEPHSPYYFPVEYRNLFHAEDFVAPTPGPEDDDQIPAIFRDLTEEEKQGIIAAYYTSASFLDHCVGKVLHGLDELGLAKDTLVFYLGDHGYCLGQHGRFEKHCFYEPAVRAPLMIRWPERTKPGSVSDALVEFIDLLPTIAEICGEKPPAEVEGKSLIPLLEGKEAKHRDTVFSEYTENEEAMVRGERYKLIYTTGRRERKDGYATGRPPAPRLTRLYDLESDPDEMRNKAEDPALANIVAELKQEMLNRLVRAGAPVAPFPGGASVEDKLDILLTPHEERNQQQ